MFLTLRAQHWRDPLFLPSSIPVSQLGGPLFAATVFLGRKMDAYQWLAVTAVFGGAQLPDVGTCPAWSFADVGYS